MIQASESSGDSRLPLYLTPKTQSSCKPSAQSRAGKIAFVVAGDYEFGIVHMFLAYRDEPGIHMNVFRDIEAARIWLDEQ